MAMQHSGETEWLVEYDGVKYRFTRTTANEEDVLEKVVAFLTSIDIIAGSVWEFALYVRKEVNQLTIVRKEDGESSIFAVCCLVYWGDREVLSLFEREEAPSLQIANDLILSTKSYGKRYSNVPVALAEELIRPNFANWPIIKFSTKVDQIKSFQSASRNDDVSMRMDVEELDEWDREFLQLSNRELFIYTCKNKSYVACEIRDEQHKLEGYGMLRLREKEGIAILGPIYVSREDRGKELVEKIFGCWDERSQITEVIAYVLETSLGATVFDTLHFQKERPYRICQTVNAEGVAPPKDRIIALSGLMFDVY